MSALGEALRDADAGVRAEACRRAAVDASAAAWIEALARALADESPHVRRAAGEALAAVARHGGATRQSVERALARALRGDAGPARFAAVRALAQLGPPESAWLPACIEALASDEGDARWAAARTLVAIGRSDESVALVLFAVARGDADGRASHVRSSPGAARRMALFALAELAPDADGLGELVCDALAERDVALARAAAAVAARLASPGEPLANALIAIVDGERARDASLRAIAALALAEIAARDATLRPRVAALLARAGERDGSEAIAHAAARLARGA